jgi:septum formation protein
MSTRNCAAPTSCPPIPWSRSAGASCRRRLNDEDVEAYLASGEWRGKAGAYAAQGIAGSFIVKLVGSYSNVVGLPLYETTQLLLGEGYPIRFGWLNAV